LLILNHIICIIDIEEERGEEMCKAPERIKQLRKSRDFSQTELAERLGYKNYTTVTKWEAGTNLPRGNELRKMAELFNVSTDYILGLSDEKNIKPTIYTKYNKLEPRRQKKTEEFINHQLDEQNKLKETIQVYGQTAAGAPVDYVDGFVDEEEVSEIPEGADRTLRIKGSSMSPLLEDGQLVFYKAQPQIENGQVGIFEIHGNAVTCKRYKLDFDNQKVVLQSENDGYDDMIFDENEVKVLGEVKF